jgi:hypothetical protein
VRDKSDNQLYILKTPSINLADDVMPYALFNVKIGSANAFIILILLKPMRQVGHVIIYI